MVDWTERKRLERRGFWLALLAFVVGLAVSAAAVAWLHIGPGLGIVSLGLVSAAVYWLAGGRDARKLATLQDAEEREMRERALARRQGPGGH